MLSSLRAGCLGGVPTGGKIEKFSLDALINMLARAGMRVEMKVKKAAWLKRIRAAWPQSARPTRG